VLSLEPVRGGRAGIPGAAGRGSGQAILVALMVVAFLVLVIARVTPPVSGEPPASFDVGVFGSAAPGASGGSVPSYPTPLATPTPVASAPSAEPSSSAGPSASVPASVAPASAGPSGAPSAARSPGAAGTTYRVKGGDTLSGIAARFGTTVRALKAANALTDAGVIHPGQVIVIPH
jgi:LysM repeat protein